MEIIGQNYPRVTTIIQETEDPEKRQKLMKWIKKMEKIHGVEGAVIERQNILDNGTNLHQAIEDYLGDKIDPSNHESLRLVLPLLKVIKKESHNNLIIEKRLFSHKHKFQGKPDLICEFDELTTIIDWTTSQKIKIKQWVDHKFIQAGAYAIACEEIGIKVEQLAVVVICGSENKCQVFTDPPKQWQIEFLKRLGQYHKINQNN